MSSSNKDVSLDQIVSLCKRRGFVYHSGDIYGGLNGVYDFGHIGFLLKQNIYSLWMKHITANLDPVIFLDGSLLGLPAMWQASGHVQNFHDPMVDCLHCKKRYRTDDIDREKPCPHCGIKNWTESRQFNMMFQTQVGATSDPSSIAYLRPETAQTIFINFKNVLATSRVKIPFGIAQIGKAFRNEITPKQFLFRMREFQQMELEWFCHPDDAAHFFSLITNERQNFYQSIGISKEKIRIHPHGKDELAHYSVACNDIEYHFPFGWKELEGIAHRGDFDLSAHSKHSGKDLSIFDEEKKNSYTPFVIESSVGVDRLFLTLLFDAYCQDTVDGEERIVLKLHPHVAPITAAFFPLTKKQADATKAIFSTLRKKGFSVQYDETGSIGKRYRRQDEIGTPACFTYDFTSETDQCVTVRNRDTTEQKRIAINDIETYLNSLLQ